MLIEIAETALLRLKKTLLISPKPPPLFLFARLLFGFAKNFSEGDGLLLFIVALAPPFPCTGNKKELPDKICCIKIDFMLVYK